MIEVFKILHGYYDNINNFSLLPHVDFAKRGNKYKLYQSSVKYYRIEGTLSPAEWWHNGIVCLMVLWTLILSIVLNVHYINSGLIKMFWEADFTGTGNRSLCLLLLLVM